MAEYITTPQAAEQLGCSVRTVHRAAERAGIEKISGRFLFTAKQIKALAKFINESSGNPKIAEQSANGVAARRLRRSGD